LSHFLILIFYLVFSIFDKDNLAVTFLDVGQGDAILVDYGTTEVLIDGGETSPGVVPYLREYVDGDLEAIVATHPHADHLGRLVEVLSRYQVEQVLSPASDYSSLQYDQWRDIIQQKGIKSTVQNIR
jgi:competence protein ComEC